jgi:hypothetical protein
MKNMVGSYSAIVKDLCTVCWHMLQPLFVNCLQLCTAVYASVGLSSVVQEPAGSIYFSGLCNG